MIPVLAAGAVGLATFFGIKQFVKAAPKSSFGPPPNFKEPPAASAVPAGRQVQGLPVVTASQFAAQAPEQQANIRAQALAGILTLTATNGTLFVEKGPDKPEAFIGAFKPTDELKGAFLTVDPGLSRRFGVPLPIPDGGNMIFEALDDPKGNTTLPCISRDPRAPDLKLDIPLNAITGAGGA